VSKGNSPPSRRSPQGQIVQEIKHIQYKGTLPPASELQEYDRIYPGAAKIVFDGFQAQYTHRHNMERILVSTDAYLAKWGQRFAFALGLALMGTAIFFAFRGEPAYAIGAVILAIGQSTAPFLVRSYQSSQERKLQTDQMAALQRSQQQ
jgi:uncharacterized membrane protein